MAANLDGNAAEGVMGPNLQFDIENHGPLPLGKRQRVDLTDSINTRHLGANGKLIDDDCQKRDAARTDWPAQIALGSAIGTGLLIGTGSSLAAGGPVGLLIGYIIVGFAVQIVMSAHAEMSAWLPMRDGVTGYAARFVDPAVGFATGWNYTFTHLMLLPINLAVTAKLIQYWDPDMSPTTWVIIVAAVVFAANMLGAGVFAEIEYAFTVLKLLIIAMFMVLAMVVASNEGPTKIHDFRPWSQPGPFSTLMAPGDKGRALGVWNAFVQAVFAYLGTEMVAVAFGETPDPLQSMAKVAKKTSTRIFGLYLLVIFAIGVSVPHTNPALQHATATSRDTSPFILAASGNARLVSAANAMLLVFTISAANANVYLASRALWSLSRNHQAPAFLQRTNKKGVPVRAVFTAVLFSALGFVSINDSAMEACRYFVSLATSFGVLNWLSILGSHVAMTEAMTAQAVSRIVMPHRSILLPWSAHFSGFILALVIVLNGVVAAYPTNRPGVVFVGYAAPILFLGNIILWRRLRRTKRRDPLHVDLETNRST